MKSNRRNFIKKIGIAGAGFSVLPTLSAFNNPLKQNASEINNNSLTVNDSKIYSISILQTTDIHCQLHPHDELFWENNKAVFRKTGGYAHLAGYLEKTRSNYDYSFLIDTGDMFQGSELSVKTTGKAIVPILNNLNYDLYIPGNWEVIYYKKSMQELLGSLHAPKICTNMFHEIADGKKGDLIFLPYYTWFVAGIKIGFLAYTDPLVPIRQSPNYSKGIVYTKPEENIQFYVDLLRNQEKCEMVILLSHLGLSQQIHLANSEYCKGVDYIFGGDTHERVRKPIVCKYSKVVEPGAFGSFVGRLELKIQNGKLIEENYHLDEINSNAYLANEKIENIIKENEAPFKEDISRIVGYSKQPLYRYFVIENTIDTLILNALKYQVKEADFVLSNGFRFCPPNVSPDKTGNIPITEGYIYDMLPVNSTVRKGEVTGKQIMDWLEKELNNVFAQNAAERFGGWVVKFKGMKVQFYAFGEKGKRVKEVTIKNKPLDIEKIYTICACEREGDPDDMLCRIKNVKNATNTPFTLHSTMIKYLQENSPVSVIPEKNAVALDATENLLTQVWGVDYEFK